MNMNSNDPHIVFTLSHGVEHITKTASDCMFKLTRVKRIKHFLDQSTLMYLINAFVFCKLFYCSTVWSNTSNENTRKLQLVQNYVCRIVTGLKKYDHISEALKSLKWLNVNKKLLFNDLVMVYKCMNNLTPDYLRERFKEIPGKRVSSRCPSAGSRQGKGLLPSVGLKFLILYLSLLEIRNPR